MFLLVLLAGGHLITVVVTTLLLVLVPRVLDPQRVFQLLEHDLSLSLLEYLLLKPFDFLAPQNLIVYLFFESGFEFVFGVCGWHGPTQTIRLLQRFEPFLDSVYLQAS